MHRGRRLRADPSNPSMKRASAATARRSLRHQKRCVTEEERLARLKENDELKAKQEQAYHRLRAAKVKDALMGKMNGVSQLHGRKFSDAAFDPEALAENVYDYIVVGSGYAGSIMAMRLAQKGHSVLVVEKGQRWEGTAPGDDWEVTRTTWNPLLNLSGLQEVTPVGKTLDVVSGVGVGGSSLTKGDKMDHPEPAAFGEGAWAEVTSPEEMAKYLRVTKRMIGLGQQPFSTEPDALVGDAAEDLGLDAELLPADAAIFFGSQTGKVLGRVLRDEERERLLTTTLHKKSAGFGMESTRASHSTGRAIIQRSALGTDGDISSHGRAVWEDPFYGGVGPQRSPCVACAKCDINCASNAKNTMENTYGYLAERRYDATIIPNCTAEAVRFMGEPTEEDPARYVVDVKLRSIIPRKYFRKELGMQMFGKPIDVRLRARNVVMAAGAVGTNRLLLAMQQDELGLPELPESLGTGVRANHTASYLVNPLDDTDAGTPEGRDFSRGVSTTSYLKARGTTGGETHTVEVQHLGPRCSFSRFSYLPSVEGESTGARLVAVLRKLASSPIETLRWLTRGEWTNSCFVVRETWPCAGTLRVALGGRGRLVVTEAEGDTPGGAPGTLAARIAADVVGKLGGGWVCRTFREGVAGRSQARDLVGGAALGSVLKANNESKQYPGLYVVDSACVPGSLSGHSSTLTVCALAERAASFIPESAAGPGKPRLYDHVPWATIEERDKGKHLSDDLIRPDYEPPATSASAA